MVSVLRDAAGGPVAACGQPQVAPTALPVRCIAFGVGCGRLQAAPASLSVRLITFGAPCERLQAVPASVAEIFIAVGVARGHLHASR